MIRNVIVKVFSVENKKFTVRRFHARKGTHFVESDIEKILDGFVDEIERQMPHSEYRMTQVGPGAYNFVWDSYQIPEKFKTLTTSVKEPNSTESV